MTPEFTGGARVFISHSAKEESASKALSALVGALTTEQFDVLLDKTRLELGGEWREELHSWMCLCHGAVILFSDAALASEWVLQEATILNWRRRNDSQFVLIPVFLDDVEAAIPHSRFRHLALMEVQGIAKMGQDEMIAKLVERLKPLHEQRRRWTPQEELEQRLAQIIYREVRLEVLDQFCREFHAAALPWVPGRDPYVAMARRMLQAEFDTAMYGVRRVAPYFSRTARRQLLELLAPTWVDLRPALRIQEISSRRDGQRTLGVNGSLIDFTAHMYVRRASFSNPTWKLVTAHSAIGEDPAASLIMELWCSLRRELAMDEFSDAEAREYLDRAVDDGDRYFVLFAPPVPDEDLLRRLRDEFPQLVFFVLSGDVMPELGGSPLNIEFLEPLLEPSRERNAHRTYTLASREVDRMS